MQEITVTVKEEVFSFLSFGDWCDDAKAHFAFAGLAGRDVICVDAQGRICRSGKEFMRADREKSFPVRVFRVLWD